MKTQTIRKYIKKYGVPEYLSAFGFQIQWDKEYEIEENKLKSEKEIVNAFMNFLKMWRIDEIYPAGTWGKYMAWATSDRIGIGIATVQWKNCFGELCTCENYNYYDEE